MTIRAPSRLHFLPTSPVTHRVGNRLTTYAANYIGGSLQRNSPAGPYFSPTAFLPAVNFVLITTIWLRMTTTRTRRKNENGKNDGPTLPCPWAIQWRDCRVYININIYHYQSISTFIIFDVWINFILHLEYPSHVSSYLL